MRVFVSAHPSARPHASPGLVAGLEVEVRDTCTVLVVSECVDEASLGPSLEARPTGREYRGLPWWEARCVRA